MKHNLIPYSPVLQESFIYDNTIRTRILYIVVLIAFGILIILMPLIRINISYRARGIILPSSAHELCQPSHAGLPSADSAAHPDPCPGVQKIAELFIPSKDMAHIHEGRKVRLQVDAYDYNRWGCLQGEIISVSDEYEIYENTTVFNVKCRLEKDYLSLKNGNKGTLRPGMTVTARFLTAKRSLFQWLFRRSGG